MVLTQHYLKEVLDYDRITGIFTWKKLPTHQCNLLGKRAGSIYANGYRYIQIEDNGYRSGRLAWLYVTGVWPPAFVDHKDTDKSNDIFDNLRLASNSQNQANRGPPSNNISGTKGVRFERDRNRWRAQIMVNGHSRNLGRFLTRDEAVEAYEKAAKLAWGDFARSKDDAGKKDRIQAGLASLGLA